MAVNEKLGVTLASKPKFPELDRTAQQLKAILDVYLPEWVELERYNQAKKYEIDDGEKGKELLFSYLEAQEIFDNAYRQFAAQLKTVEVIKREKRMANDKKEGYLLE